MIGTDYTPGLLADLAKKPHVRSLEIPVTPNGQRITSYTRSYTDVDKDSTRFGLILDHEVEKIAVSSSPKGLSVSFVLRGRDLGRA